MSNRRSYFVNYPTSTLLVVLTQRIKELEEINRKIEKGKTKRVGPLLQRKKNLEFVINVAKGIVIDRYLETDPPLNACLNIIVYGRGIKKEIFKDVFVYRLMNNEEMVDLELLECAINELDLAQIQNIMFTKKNTIFAKLADRRFEQIIFDVDDSVYEEFVKKMIMDRKEG